ncbi:MAG: cupin domain-containing protein [Gemmatimonadetes bacterium]|nr:cupin domain-containing protein [Gemmatimonadota bacterium]MYG16188.1 cupin domain-containing protein [Gemmatimonadota bacterium]MYH19511.1 cupin domain-containing protein [Gemmatimonadota bacterium]MYK98530.1 cupin domain-containing protein [Gemmatimonadota bacterium]
MSIRVRNWRDQAPYVGHISALVWTLYQSHDKDATSPPEINRLHGINSFVKHGLQGHQHSDHHHHDAIEQLYFILRGRGQLLIGDDKVDVRDGTAVYMPVNVPHQAFNDGEGWMEHLIVSCPLDEIREGTPAVRDWRDVHPVVLEGGTVSWPLLRREEDAPAGEGGVLQRVHSVTRYAVQGRQGTDWQQLDGIELVHYVLSGFGIVEDLDGDRQLVTEGSAAHVLPGVAHRFANQSEGWLEYVTFAVEVGEVEAPDESDEFEESEKPAVEYGVEDVAAAAVVAEVDWDDADAVETEEEIEEDGTDDEADDDVESAQAEDVVDDDVESAEAEDEDEAEDEAEAAVEAAVDDEAGGDGIDDEAGESAVADEEYEADEADEDIEVVEEGNGEDGEDAEEDVVESAEATDDSEPEAAVEDAEDAEAEEEDVAEADQAEASEKAEADDDDFDLEDDDADFDIEDEDETVVEDETGEDDESPDADRR